MQHLNVVIYTNQKHNLGYEDMQLGLQSVTYVGRNDLDIWRLSSICGSMKELVVPDWRCLHID